MCQLALESINFKWFYEATDFKAVFKTTPYIVTSQGQQEATAKVHIFTNSDKEKLYPLFLFIN